MKMSLLPTQKAWLSGFIDGEGFIGITFQRKKTTSQQSASPRYHPFLIVTNNDQNSILYIKNLVGDGRIYRLTRHNTSLSPSFQYKLTKREALKILLNAIKPYLVVKRRQADCVLKYLAIRDGRKIITGGGSRGMTSFSQEEENIYQQLLMLNSRGKKEKI